MQLLLVCIVIFVPQSVTLFLEKEKVVDVNKIQIDMPRREDTPPADEADRRNPFGPQK
jgi:hypothetical protein